MKQAPTIKGRRAMAMNHQKNSSWLKNISGILKKGTCLAMIGINLCITLGGCSGSPSEAPVNETLDEKAETTIEATEAETTDHSADESSQATNPRIGEPVSTDLFEFTITNAYTVDFLGEGKKIPEGAIYVALEFEYKNISKQPISSSDLPTVHLMDGNDAVYSHDSDASWYFDGYSDEKIISDMNPGIKTKGAEIFEVSEEILNEGGMRAYVEADQEFMVDLDISQTSAYGIGDNTQEAVQDSYEYIFPDSNIRLLTEEEMNALSQDELRIAVNEIYARHGRKFADTMLQEYFNAKSWYEGTIEPDQFNEAVFNEFEKENVKKLSEKKSGQPSGTLAVEQIYGLYECHTEYLDAELEVGVYTGDNTDYIRLVGLSPDGRGTGEFDGIVVSTKENNYTAVDEFGNVIDVYFDGSGNARVTDGNTGLGGMNFPGFEGIYQMTADFSHAG